MVIFDNQFYSGAFCIVRPLMVEMMSSENILTESDLFDLTKYRQRKKQCAWLASAGIWFKEDRNGAPVTTWFHVNNPIPLRGPHNFSSESNEPNFDAM